MSSPCGCKTTGHEPDCWMLHQTNLVEPPSDATWRGLPQSRQEGFWFTVDSLAAAIGKARLTGIGPPTSVYEPDQSMWARAIIKAAKEASE